MDNIKTIIAPNRPQTIERPVPFFKLLKNDDIVHIPFVVGVENKRLYIV